MNGKTWYYVADAVTGKPIPKANVEFFGYRTEWVDSKVRRALGRRINVFTDQFAEYTDEHGQIILDRKEQSNNYQWLLIARSKDGRTATLGFTHVWYGNYYDQEYNQTKSIYLTDRPVYRPGHTVKFKSWVRYAKYDHEET